MLESIWVSFVPSGLCVASGHLYWPDSKTPATAMNVEVGTPNTRDPVVAVAIPSSCQSFGVQGWTWEGRVGL